MAIVDDYAGIAAELRRLRAEREPEKTRIEAHRQPAPSGSHPMRLTPAGEILYRRLVAQRRR